MTFAVSTPRNPTIPSSYRTGDLGFVHQDFSGGGMSQGDCFFPAGLYDPYRTRIDL